MYHNENQRKITWYRSRLDRETLKSLNQRSDWKGWLEVLGHLGLVVLTGTAAVYAEGRFPLGVLFVILFFHGTFYAFLGNGSHELSHNSVFKTRVLNTFFYRFFCFLVWRNHSMFSASHGEHHKYTLHPPDDLEVVLPVELSVKGFLKNAVISPWTLYSTLYTTIRLSFGKLTGDWETHLFTESNPASRRHLFSWPRIMFLGHVLLVGFSFYFGFWMLPILITFAPFYGGWLRYLCNGTQHAGLGDNVADFRLCTRTIILNPFLTFLYWHMNYHIEHHMYASVPCYNLGKLHKLIKPELPHCPKGLLTAWKQIISIIKKQRTQPEYQYVPELPVQV